MDSLDAQCLVFGLLAEQAAVPPDRWIHDADGSLTWCYRGSQNTFTWTREEVARTARRWRDEGAAVPAAIARMVDAHLAMVSILEHGDVDPPDAVLHDLDTQEVAAQWVKDKRTVIVECRADVPA